VDIETTALGAAYLAGLAVGFFQGIGDLESFWQKERVFEPNMPETKREELFAGWHEALRRARG
jgi:glycerol kinase